MRVRYWLGYKARWVYTCQHFCVWSSLLCSTIITKYSNHRSSQSDRFVSFVLGPSPFYTHRVLVAPDIDKLANTYSFFGANLFVHGLFCLPMVYIRGHVIRLSPTKLLVFTLFIWGGGGNRDEDSDIKNQLCMYRLYNGTCCHFERHEFVNERKPWRVRSLIFVSVHTRRG